MVLAAYDTSNLVALYNNGVQCTSCCSFEPGLCCPGFGADSTPSFYTAVIEGVVDCPGHPGDATIVNGTWQLPLIECEDFPFPEEPGCTWQIKNDSVWIAVVRNRTLAPCAEVSLSALIKDAGNYHGVFFDQKSYTISTGWCSDFTNDLTDCTTYGKDGTAKIWPLSWPAWVTATVYSVGDQVNHGGALYECTVDHISGVANEPGVGIDWAIYWDVGDPCGAANVACP